jgi:hypothetical protein
MLLIMEKEVTNFIIVLQSTENFFGAFVHHYVYDKKFNNPYVIAPPMLNKLNKTDFPAMLWIIQLCFES